MKGLRVVAVLGLLGLVSAGLGYGAAGAAADKGPPPGASFDVNDCKTCHEKAVTGMHGTQHANAEASCASCHAGAAEHAKSVLETGEPGPTPSFKKLKAREVNETCLTCHDKGHQANFAGGVHDRRGVSCTSCHSVHDAKSVKGQLKTASEAENCYSCHSQIRSKAMRVSHHPMREGLMSCSSCHDAHASKPKMISAEFVTEKCLECHTEKRGPFLWEHAPVRENCMNCHDAHGSNHDKLLVAKQPFLCQRCHLNTRHPGTLYDGRNSVLGASLSNRAVEHSCRNCHQNIHGGNAPSGPYLGR
jgi:DmsE family decaheme c-type cytochrome